MQLCRLVEKSPGAKSHYNQPDGDDINPPSGHRPGCVCVCVCVCLCVCSDQVKPLSSIAFCVISSKKRGLSCNTTVCLFVQICLHVCVCVCVLMNLMVFSDKCSFNQTLEFPLSLIMRDLMMRRALLSSLKQTLVLCLSLSLPLSLSLKFNSSNFVHHTSNKECFLQKEESKEMNIRGGGQKN